MLLAAFACALLAMGDVPAAAQATLDAVKGRGELRCGVNGDLPGFSARDGKGAWSGFDVDLCRALAAAIFDDPSKVAFLPLSAESRFAALVSGSVDVLSRNTTWTLSREAALGIQFAVVTYYDGQGFMVHESRGVTSPLDLAGARICVQKDTTSSLNLTDYFRANDIGFQAVPLSSVSQAVEAYSEGRCDALTSDVSQLYAERAQLPVPQEHMILGDIISKEPLGPAVRQGDDRWLNVVKWTHYAMVNAEELGISQATVTQAMASKRAEVQRLLGVYAALGEALGLANDWAARSIRHVGNYGESFERNLGAETKLAIPRGLNRLWTDGGIQYAPPIR
jgi:general L-amino acid transport system substrate-binding protein